jgi:Poly(A) polymerase central domain
MNEINWLSFILPRSKLTRSLLIANTVALTVQLYPNACPAAILRKFFLVFKTWRWPQPLMLTKPHDAGYGLQVWSQQQSARQVAPMITPAYPAMNSTLAVSRQTLQIMQEEFHRAHEIVDQLWKDYQRDPHQELNWGKLFAPTDFFISYPVCHNSNTFQLILKQLPNLTNHFVVLFECNSATFLYVLWAPPNKMPKLGLVLWNPDCESWCLIYWHGAYPSRKFNYFQRKSKHVWRIKLRY